MCSLHGCPMDTHPGSFSLLPVPLVCSGWPAGWPPAGALGVGRDGSQLPGPPLRAQAGRGQPTAPTWRSSCQVTHPCSQGINCSQTRSARSLYPIPSCLGRPGHPSSQDVGTFIGLLMAKPVTDFSLCILRLKDDHRNWTG